MAVLDRLDHLAPVVVALFFALPLALVLLAGAAVRARLVPWPALAGAVVFFVADMVPVPGAEVVQLLIGLVTFGAIARRIAAVPAAPSPDVPIPAPAF